jgi:riboflavin synthase
MFTGIVKGLGTVVAIDHRDEFLDLTVNVGTVLDHTEIGASVAIDGVCLTVIAIDGTKWKFSVMKETLEKTTIGDRNVGDHVCLEQPLRMGEEMGGHMVLGHVDGTGEVIEKRLDGENCWMTIRTGEFFKKYIVQKGSIAIDGVSLTICDPTPSGSPLAGGGIFGVDFSVSLLPLTLSLTTLGAKQVGERVNLEADYLLKAMMQ